MLVQLEDILKEKRRGKFTKVEMKGHNFSSDTEVIAAAETWLDGQYS
jgi:hypothetical protein